MSAPADLYAVVPAAGTGSRMKLDTPKQFLEINGRAVLVQTVDRLLEITAIQKVVLAVEQTSIEIIKALPFRDTGRIEICTGGVSRAESVLNGLAHLEAYATPETRVLIHDAARPCVRTADIQRLIEEADDEHGGLLATKVSDTVKRANEQQQAVETLDRQGLWCAATPQIFNLHQLFKALNIALRDGVTVTDEASAMQHAGYRPKLIECHTDNIKITTSPDLVLAAHYLTTQESENG